MAYQSTKRYSLLFKPHTDFTTPPTLGAVGTWAGVDCIRPPEFTPARMIVDRNDAPTTSAGAVRPPIVGSRDGGTLTFSVRLSSMNTGYDASAAVPVLNLSDPTASTNPLHNLLAQFLTGSTIGASHAAGVGAAAGTDADTLELAGGPPTLKVGAAYWHNAISGAGLQPIVTKTQSGTTVQLLEDYRTQTNMASAELFPSLTLFPQVAATPKIMQFRIVNNLTLDSVYTGAYPKTLKLKLSPGSPPEAEFTYVCWHTKDTSSFALQTPPARQEIPPFLNSSNGRFHLGGPQTKNGTFAVADDATCVNELEVTIEVPEDPILCHGHGGVGTFQGISDRVMADLDITVSMSIAHQDSLDDGVDDTLWDSYLDNATERGITLYGGRTEGAVMALAIPAAVLTAQAEPIIVGQSLAGHRLTWKPVDWTADDATEAGDTPFRLAFG